MTFLVSVGLTNFGGLKKSWRKSFMLFNPFLSGTVLPVLFSGIFLSSPGNLYLNLTRRVSVLKKTTLKPRTKLHGVHNLKSSESKYLNIDPFLFRIQLQPNWSWWMWVWLAIQEEHVQHVTITITIIIIIRHVTIIRKNMSNMSRWHGVIRKSASSFAD